MPTTLLLAAGHGCGVEKVAVRTRAFRVAKGVALKVVFCLSPAAPVSPDALLTPLPGTQLKLSWKAQLSSSERFLVTAGAGLFGVFVLWRLPGATGFMTRHFLHFPLNRELAEPTRCWLAIAAQADTVPLQCECRR